MSINVMFTYNQYSEGGAELAKALGIPRLKHSGSKFTPGSSKTILNWGASSERFPSAYNTCRVINPPAVIDVACNKISAFRRMQQQHVSIPEFTTNLEEARNWLRNGEMVFARTQLTAHSGRGIVIMDPDHQDTWSQQAPLYVKYIEKKSEYRVHVVRGQITDIQRKGLRAELKGTEGVNFKIRNLANGFVYVRFDDNNVPLLTSATVPQCVKDVGIAAVNALGLDFGAADIIWQKKTNRAWALEVNCAPGLSGTTVENYAAALGAL